MRPFSRNEGRVNPVVAVITNVSFAAIRLDIDGHAGCAIRLARPPSTPDLRSSFPTANEHDKAGQLHFVEILPGSRLADIIVRPRIEVNSLHREAIAQLSPAVIASAYAEDGIIEAIEIVTSLAIGFQWHQELLTAQDHPGNRIFQSFVEAAA